MYGGCVLSDHGLLVDEIAAKINTAQLSCKHILTAGWSQFLDRRLVLEKKIMFL